MPYKDPEQQKLHGAQYYQKNRAKILSRVKRYAKKNKEKIRIQHHEWYCQNKAEISATAKIVRATDGEKIRAKDRARRAKNPEIFRSRDRERYLKRKDEVKNRVKKFRKKHPYKHADAQRKRRALKSGATADLVLHALILERDGPYCAFCGTLTTLPVYRKYSPTDRHYDHIIPLSRGGSHTQNNIRILCANCNLHKHCRLDSEFFIP